MQTLALEKRTIFKDFALVLAASFLISLSGYLSIPLWFTPVPIATQNSVVLLIAALLGSRRGTLATFAFLAQGAMGLPVFSNGAGGFIHLLGPTGGYLVGYLVAALAVGLIAEKRRTLKSAVMALLTGNFIIYLLGAGYLATFVGIEKAFWLGVAPFLFGCFLKFLVSLQVLKWAGWSKSR